MVTITFLPDKKQVKVDKGTDLLTAAIKAGIHIYNSCGGEGVCGRCKIIIKKGQFTTEYSGKLSEKERKKGYVIACRTIPESDLEVFIPENSRLADIEILTGKARQNRLVGLYTPLEEIVEQPMERPGYKFFRYSPLATKIFLKLPKPSSEDRRSDIERLFQEIRNVKNPPVMQMGLANIKKLPSLLRQSNWEITATLGNRNGTTEVVIIEPGDTTNVNFGVALDIGTTTIVAYLVDLNTQSVLAAKACYNPQVDFGEDVITRIIYAEKEEGLERLHHAVIDAVNTLIHNLAKQTNITLDDITSVVSAGNTTMTHLLLKIEPTFIRRSPYVPVIGSVPVIRAAEAGIKIHPRGLLACLPCIGSYIGGDIVAGILASGMDDIKEPALFIDLGTNGEVVIGNRDYYIATSTSAGPCFEGGGLSSGVRAVKGAIQSASIKNGKLVFETIGGYPPSGICGSGAIDAISALFENKIIDRSGKINPGTNSKIRIKEIDGVRAIVLVEAQDSGTGQEIIIDENDIKNVIHSKGAIYTGIETILKESGYAMSDLRYIYIAGGLGTSLNIRSAINIGLLPDLPVERFRFVGNTSIEGALECLLSGEAMERANSISSRMVYLDLSDNPFFMNNYSASLFLPHTELGLFPSVKEWLNSR